MPFLFPTDDISTKKINFVSNGRSIPLLILSPLEGAKDAAGIMWIHGGGYFLGMKEMVFMSRAVDLVRNFGAVVVSPGYRLAFQAPYPAALEDCYETLLFLKQHAAELHVRSDQLMIGGESAGGGICAALCMLARDLKTVNIAFQMPLYPMLDNMDTASSGHNHGKVWNTRRNHLGWHMYLRENAGKEVSPYASPARQTDYSGLPPAYTFVGDGEPFHDETITYIENLRKSGITADVDVLHTNVHAFDMLHPSDQTAKAARELFLMHFENAWKNCFFPQNSEKK